MSRKTNPSNPAGLIQKFANTAYDKILTVYNNLTGITLVSDNIAAVIEIGTVTDLSNLESNLILFFSTPPIGVKAPTVVSTIGNITLSGEQTINTVAVLANNRVLVRNQTDPTENGIYNVNVSTWIRSTDWDDATDVLNGVTIIDSHTSALYRCTFTGTYDPGTSSVTFNVITAPTVIDDLSDVDTSSIAPTDGQILVFDNASGDWLPASTFVGDVTGDLTGDITGNTTIGGNAIITGDLTVNGTTTTINTTELEVQDNIIRLNIDEAGTPSQNAGIEVERGTSANVQIRWNESGDYWEITNDGSTYSQLLNATLTDALIKTANERNTNTNEFNDAEKTKLGTVSSGAEVNPGVISQAEAEAGTATDERIFTAERVKQAIVAQAGGGLLPKTIEIGSWDMDTVYSVNVAHGLDIANIRDVSVSIRSDGDSIRRPLNGTRGQAVTMAQLGFWHADATNVICQAPTGSPYDGDGDYNGSANRGWVIIQHVTP